MHSHAVYVLTLGIIYILNFIISGNSFRVNRTKRITHSTASIFHYDSCTRFSSYLISILFRTAILTTAITLIQKYSDIIRVQMNFIHTTIINSLTWIKHGLYILFFGLLNSALLRNYHVLSKRIGRTQYHIL